MCRISCTIYSETETLSAWSCVSCCFISIKTQVDKKRIVSQFQGCVMGNRNGSCHALQMRYAYSCGHAVSHASCKVSHASSRRIPRTHDILIVSKFQGWIMGSTHGSYHTHIGRHACSSCHEVSHASCKISFASSWRIVWKFQGCVME